MKVNSLLCHQCWNLYVALDFHRFWVQHRVYTSPHISKVINSL